MFDVGLPAEQIVPFKAMKIFYRPFWNIPISLSAKHVLDDNYSKHILGGAFNAFKG
jgi:hypothetical protein